MTISRLLDRPDPSEVERALRDRKALDGFVTQVRFPLRS